MQIKCYIKSKKSRLKYITCKLRQNGIYISLHDKNNNGIKSLNVKIIKQVNYFKYLRSYVASTDHDVNVRIGQAWVALNNMT